MTTATRRIPTWAIDTLLAAILTVGALVDLSEINSEAVGALGYRTPDGFTIVAILLQTIPVAFRRRLPTTALLVVSAGFFIDRNLNYPSTIAIFGLLFVFHAVGSELPRRRALITGWTAIGLMTVFTISGVFAEFVSISTPLLVFSFTSFPFILGLESRERRTAEADLVVCRGNGGWVSPRHRRHLARTHNEDAVGTASRRRTPPGASRAGETRCPFLRQTTSPAGPTTGVRQG